jgi:Protein of unknown function (DUF3048) N-terminal domain/Protein of unknown function (DUF3048) C-terminal domain
MGNKNTNPDSSNEPDDPLFAALKSETPAAVPDTNVNNKVPEAETKPQPVIVGKTAESGLKHFFKEKLTRKEFIIGSIVFVILLGGSIAFGMILTAGSPATVTSKVPPPPPKPITSPLTGLPVTAAQAQLPVTGVMIENSDFARPQSGLREAGVVFEAIAEGGITRFLALYQEAAPNNIGPIRSARPYYEEWALGFDAAYAHVGGSPEALSDISAWHVRDMNEFYYGNNFHRISSRVAPHNMYTSMSELRAIEKQNGWTTSHFTGFERKKPQPTTTPTASTIDFTISWSDYYVHYKYDPATNSYLRWEGGAPHIDATSGKQLKPNVVIGLVMPYSLESDGYHSDYNTIGSGKAYIFQDGTATIGTWHKASRSSNFTFTDTSGKAIGLNPGQTWITALGSSGNITYKP